MVREGITRDLGAAIPGLGAATERCAGSDHLLDAVVAALVARAYQIGCATGPTREQAPRAAAEGRIWLPSVGPELLAPAT